MADYPPAFVAAHDTDAGRLITLGGRFLFQPSAFRMAGSMNFRWPISKLPYYIFGLAVNRGPTMPNFSTERELALLLSDAARLLRTYADQEARQFGMTRAQ
jgi:hypothetical protein